MSSCTSCGHQLGVGRFCANCGATADPSTPDGSPFSPSVAGDWRTDTAERSIPRVVVPADLTSPPAPAAPPPPPRTPPTAATPPPPPRYPLFADEVESGSPGQVVPAVADEPVESLVPGFSDAYADPGPVPDREVEDDVADERRTALPWVGVAVVVVLLVALGWWYLARDDGSADARDPSGGPGGSATARPRVADVASRARARASETAPPDEDVDGDQVSYDASNMLDGVPATAWRAPGDGSGIALRFTLSARTELTEVGLVNGYAKTSTDAQGQAFDWYLGNRRIEEVIWLFGDGTKVRQELGEDRTLQMMDLGDPVTTRKVVVRIAQVSAPGAAPAGRDFVAVSEVSLVGLAQTG